MRHVLEAEDLEPDGAFEAGRLTWIAAFGSETRRRGGSQSQPGSKGEPCGHGLPRKNGRYSVHYGVAALETAMRRS